MLLPHRDNRLVSVIVFEACNWHPNHGEMSSAAEDCICDERATGVPRERANPASGSRGVALHSDRAIACIHTWTHLCACPREKYDMRRFEMDEEHLYAGFSRV